MSYSVVIPAHNAERTLGAVVESLRAQAPAPAEILVVDDGSTDGTAALGRRLGVRVLSSRGRYAGGARNHGLGEATGEIVVFLDADAVPAPGWGAGLARAAAEFPGAVIGCARSFVARSRWGWVTHLQFETPYLARGRPRDVAFLSSYCLAVPRSLALRFPESYGAEDGLFCVRALERGVRLVFDPRFHAVHDDERETFAQLRALQRRRAFALALLGPIQRESLRKRLTSRVPLHYFLLLRLPVIAWRLRRDPALRAAFARVLPLLAVAEWTMGASAFRFALRRPPVTHQHGDAFRPDTATAARLGERGTVA